VLVGIPDAIDSILCSIVCILVAIVDLRNNKECDDQFLRKKTALKHSVIPMYIVNK